MNQVTPIPSGSGSPIPIRTKGDVFRVLNSNIPLNQFHLPDHIYRADLIDQNLLQLDHEDRSLILDSATIPLTFEHGYPALNETSPFWEQLPCESPDAYAAYMTYLELPEKSNHDNPIRLLPLISTITKHPLDIITEWCHMFYWHWRSRAYDLFLVACHRKQREQRIMSIEGAHFKMAETILSKANSLVTLKIDQELKDLQADPDAQTETKVKDLVSMIKDLVSVQRISVGLPAMGPAQVDVKLNDSRHTTVTETFKSIAKEGAGEQTTSQRSAEMDSLLDNPDDLARVQELMIKLTKPQHVLPIWGDGRSVEIDDPDPDPNNDGDDDVVEDLGNP